MDGLVPYDRAANPVTDEQGRVLVIVDFMDGAKDRYLDAARDAIDSFVAGCDRHNPQTLLLLDAKSKQYGIEPRYRKNDRGEPERSDVTTWVGASL